MSALFARDFAGMPIADRARFSRAARHSARLRHMRLRFQSVMVLVALECSATSRAESPATPPPAAGAPLLKLGKQRKVAGIVTADLGVAALAAGVGLLIASATADAPQHDSGLRHSLEAG